MIFCVLFYGVCTECYFFSLPVGGIVPYTVVNLELASMAYYDLVNDYDKDFIFCIIIL